jgi:hypothetical protein
MFSTDTKLKPSYWTSDFYQVAEDGDTKHRVEVEIYTGLGISEPEQAGWYVYCNGRAVLTADKTEKTGWSKSGLNVRYHNQFSHFRGYVYFKSDNAGVLPWTTTKADIDETSPLYKQVLQKMVEQGRPVIDFLNALDKEKQLSDRERVFTKLLKKAQLENLSKEMAAAKFDYDLPPRKVKEKMTLVSFQRPSMEVKELMKEKGCASPQELGEDLFDDAYERYIG